MKKPAKAEVTLLSDTEVRVTRRFNAPRKLVYKAYTTPALLKRWMVGSPGWSFPVCEMDLREGGSFVWRWQNDEDGKQFGFHGEFLEIEPPKRIVHSEFFDPMDIGGDMGEGTTVSLTFDEAGRCHDPDDQHALQVEGRPRSRDVDRHDRRHGDELPAARRPAAGAKRRLTTLERPPPAVTGGSRARRSLRPK